jgi:RNA methyltransferase, TrmH family
MTGAPHSSVRRYRELARNPIRNEQERELLLDGSHLLIEARTSGLTIESAAFDHDALGNPPLRMLAEQLTAEGAEVFIVSRKVLESMSPVKTPSGVVSIARRRVATLDGVLRQSGRRVPLVVVAHDLQDPGNVGGILRTAEAAGATAFVATCTTADPLGWKALRGSMGSAFRVPIARATLDDTLDALRSAAIATAALIPRGGQALFTVNLTTPTALVLGGEGGGLAPERWQQMDRQISIPMQTPVESLNVGVAAALVLYEAFRQRTAI